jgi:hypothetical protein
MGTTEVAERAPHPDGLISRVRGYESRRTTNWVCYRRTS